MVEEAFYLSVYPLWVGFKPILKFYLFLADFRR